LSDPEQLPRAVVFGCAGERLTSEERDFFARTAPLGFILFARNCRNPPQVRRLVEDLRASVGRADAPVLIDQEGGRVVRLSPPVWRAAPAAAVFGRLAASDPEGARQAVELNARLLAAELADLGITVNCLPLLDVPVAGSHDVIGDRAFADSAEVVADLGAAVMRGLLAGGVLPVIKHLPGHGRASVDSHHRLPVVGAPRKLLEETDFAPFRALAEAPLGMTAHVVYTGLDPAQPATTSQTVIDQIIRGSIGFQGLLFSDDLSMSALAGGLGDRAATALAAGCDVALHCNGKADEMAAVAAAVGPLGEPARKRWSAAQARLQPPSPFDAEEALTQLQRLLAQIGGTAA
jgi:beta-N-acetylhexosaminidase|tara:strand:- start:196 stop:1239 length:1044 start_codon:yes stop_codon:yes gene_type:complete